MKPLKKYWNVKKGFVVLSSACLFYNAHAESPTTDYKLYGHIKTDLLYDLSPNQSEQGFAPHKIPVGPTTLAPKMRFNTYHVRLGLTTQMPGISLGNYLELNPLKLTIESDFRSDVEGANLLKLRKAYADCGKLRIGQDFTTFGSTIAIPHMLDDSAYPSATGGKRLGLIRFTDQFGDDLTYEVSVEDIVTPERVPATISAAGEPAYNLETRRAIPTLAARVGYKYSLLHAQLAGIYRTMAYYDKHNKKEFSLSGYGVHAAVALNVIPDKTILKLKGTYGAGIGKYIAGLPSTTTEQADITNEGDKKPKALNVMGGFFAVEHHWTSSLQSALCVSVVQADKKKNDNIANQFKQGLYAAANVSWHPTSRIMTGIEYIWGQRTNVNGKNGQADRILATMKVKF